MPYTQVKEAYMKLTDETIKKNLLMHIENVTEEFRRERRKLINRGVRPYDIFVCVLFVLYVLFS